MNAIVIADASPLIGLARVGCLGLLKGLYGQVSMTSTVMNEVLGGGIFDDASIVKEAIASGWLKVETPVMQSVEHLTAWQQWLLNSLDDGEKESILYGLALKSGGSNVMLLIDEQLGRKAAKEVSIYIIGSLGILLAAKRKGLIKELKPIVTHMKAVGYHLSDGLINQVLVSAGEQG